jgi:hypothetical protein
MRQTSSGIAAPFSNRTKRKKGGRNTPSSLAQKPDPKMLDLKKLASVDHCAEKLKKTG